MTIQLKLFLSAAIVIISSLIIGIVIIFSIHQANKSIGNVQKSDQTVREIFHLTILLNDYLMHKEERPAKQWQIKHKQIEALLTAQNYNDPKNIAILNTIKVTHENAGNNFTQLINSSENGFSEEAQNRLTSRLLVNSESMVSNSEALSARSYAEREKTLRNVVFVITTLVALLIASTTILFFLLYRSIVGPLASLNKGAIAIAEGNWNAKVAIKNNDEIGQLTKTFNTMAKKVSDYIKKQRLMENQKDDFIAAASHELKTPLTSLIIYAQSIKSKFQKSKDPGGIDIIEKMDRQLKRLLTIVNDLLDAQKIVGGRLQYVFDYFDVNEFVTNIVKETQLTAPDHTIELKLAKHTIVYGSKEYLEQVLTNFISNAFKYSPDNKKIIVTTTIRGRTIVVSVRDFGIGITKKDQRKVFERFYRAGGNIEKTYPGIGLGLYISSQIIKRHEGKIWVKSQAGKGSTFSFSLPIRK